MALLEIDALSVAFGETRRPSVVVDRVGFAVDAGETVALVGESGSGKSVTALAVMGLLQEPGRIAGGHVRFAGRDLVGLPERELAKLRGDRIAMIFQEPMSSLNPLLSVGGHVMEPLRLHRGLSRREARAEAIRLLDRVGIPSAAQRADDYPHRLSGGMRQRVMIAAALACRPALLIADEPTTALDVTIQAQIMDLLADLQQEFGMGILFITHDLGVVAEHAHRVVVLYAGRVAERTGTARLFAAAAHPYTAALLDCIPDEGTSDRLAVIEGSVPAPGAMPPGCRFAPRCPRAVAPCRAAEPPLTEIAPGHEAACIRPVGDDGRGRAPA
ncbi:ABC transporter ATP-binding protein [Stella sp.]|uniref:ABC transporter ATP-binding protein n=1 Tax=Stella sp. TaxID=2912054 RepID=UPI0035B337CC